MEQPPLPCGLEGDQPPPRCVLAPGLWRCLALCVPRRDAQLGLALRLRFSSLWTRAARGLREWGRAKPLRHAAATANANVPGIIVVVCGCRGASKRTCLCALGGVRQWTSVRVCPALAKRHDFKVAEGRVAPTFCPESGSTTAVSLLATLPCTAPPVANTTLSEHGGGMRPARFNLCSGVCGACPLATTLGLERSTRCGYGARQLNHSVVQKANGAEVKPSHPLFILLQTRLIDLSSSQ